MLRTQNSVSQIWVQFQQKMWKGAQQGTIFLVKRTVNCPNQWHQSNFLLLPSGVSERMRRGLQDTHHSFTRYFWKPEGRFDVFLSCSLWQLSSGKLAGQYTGLFFSADLSVPTRMGSDMFSLLPKKYLAALQKYWCHPKPFSSICPLLSLCCSESGTSVWLCHPSSLQV